MELGRSLRQSPHSPVALRARDGLTALQTAVAGDFRHAHVRLNMMLHSGGIAPAALQLSMTAPEVLPSLFFPHELLLYRGVCSLYLGDLSTAIQDFATSLELLRQLVVAATSEDTFARRLPPEATSWERLACFECECLSNVALGHLMVRDYHAAAATIERLLINQEALAGLGPSALSFAWFLAGVCQLALGDSSDVRAQESFLRSYSYGPTYVDDFLRRHQDISAGTEPPGPRPGPRRFGGPVPARSSPSHSAGNAVVCCLISSVHRGSSSSAGDEAGFEAQGGGTHSRLSGLLPPLRLQIRDVVIWGQPCIGWPCVRPPELQTPIALARLDLLQNGKEDRLRLSGKVSNH